MLTKDEVDAAIAMHNERVSWDKVAEKLGRTKREILVALRDRGIRTWISWSKAEEEAAVELHKEGKSYKEIGGELARTEHSVATKLSWLLSNPSSRRKAGTAITLPGWGPALVWPTRSIRPGRAGRADKVSDEEEW